MEANFTEWEKIDFEFLALAVTLAYEESTCFNRSSNHLIQYHGELPALASSCPQVEYETSIENTTVI